MAGIESIARNLETEDAWYAKDLLDANAPSEDMRITAARDVTVYHGASPDARAEATARPPTPDPVKQSALAKSLPYVLAAALGAGATGLPWLISAMRPAAETAPDADTQYILDLLPG